MPIRAILYDFDGTVVNSEKVNFQCWKDCMQLQGITLTEEEYLTEYIGYPAIRNIKRAIALHDLKVSVEEMLENGQKWYQERPEAKVFHFMPHALETIEFYHERGIRLAIVTGSQRHSIDRFFHQNPKMNNYFEVSVTASDVPKSKPHPASYQLALQQLQLDASEAIAFEDSVSGTTSAQGAGLVCFAIQQAATLRRQLTFADQLFYNLEEARQFLASRYLNE